MANKLRQLPMQQRLRALLSYDHASGTLTWRARDLALFTAGSHSAEHNRDKWNARWAGQEAFTAVKGDGYRHGAIDGTHYAAHRVIWKWMTGTDPIEVDHINGDRADNTWSNLRSVTRTTNGRNLTRRRDNTSGTTGVRYVARGGLWQSYIIRGRMFISLGSYKNIDDAIRARKEGEREHGFHPNHGREAVT